MRDGSAHTAAGISRADIADAALRLVRRRGVRGLTMRAVADELGVQAPSLYHHIRNKGHLLDLVARAAFESLSADVLVWAEVSSPAEWIELVRTTSVTLLKFYRRHPGLAVAVLVNGDPRREDAGHRSRRPEVDALVRLGVPARQAHTLVDYAARWTVAAIAADGSPHSGVTREDRLFRGGLDLLLAGLQARILSAVGDPG